MWAWVRKMPSIFGALPPLVFRSSSSWSFQSGVASKSQARLPSRSRIARLAAKWRGSLPSQWSSAAGLLAAGLRVAGVLGDSQHHQLERRLARGFGLGRGHPFSQQERRAIDPGTSEEVYAGGGL